MLVQRKSSELTIDLDKKEDALGLYAVLSGNPGSVPPELLKKGQEIYNWFFESVQKLAINFEEETRLKYRKNIPR